MKKTFDIFWSLILLLFVALGTLSESTLAVSNIEKTEVAIDWIPWSGEAFDRAVAEDKLILLDLTAVWCHACHVMDQQTYSDSGIVNLLNSKFVSIRVDTDQRPDVESRYRSGGWPTTSILLPTGEILFQANALDPEELGEALRESENMYRTSKEDLLNRAKEIWEKVEQAKKNQKPSGAHIDPTIPIQAAQLLKEDFDDQHGGFREAPKFFEPEALTLAFHLDNQFPGENLKHVALFTLDKQSKLIDPVWGGFYRYATQSDWSHPHYEKMLQIQALNMLNYLEAYQITGDPRYKAIVEGTLRYVHRFLKNSKHSGFYASQDAVVRPKNNAKSFVTGENYFHLNEPQRLALGIPLVDRSVFTGWNALMASSYLKIYQVLGDDRLKDFALKTLNRLWTERYEPSKGLAHVTRKGRPFGYGWLEDQVFFAMASIEAFITTNDRKFLTRAQELTQFMKEFLRDNQGGGFFDRPPQPTDRGLLKFPSKPLEVNVHTAILFCDLYYLTSTQAYKMEAERSLQYVLNSSGPLPVALTALGVDRFYRYPVHIVLVGDLQEPRSQALFKQALQLYSPGKIVRTLNPQFDTLTIGEVSFPPTVEPTAYICTDKLCSAPVHDPKELSPTYLELLENLNATDDLALHRSGT